MLKVPYAGDIAAAGRREAEVEKEVERRLASRAIEPQAVITIQESRSSQVSVLGDVRNGTRLSLDPGGERVLDAISRAGGLSSPGAETNITLQRKGTTATVLFDELVATPSENIYLYPGDIIYANRERRTYLAFGASGLNGRIDFEESDLSLAEAVGKAGGLLDDRADPGQVFVYRQIDVAELTRLGLTPPATAKTAYPVIFRVNMRKPNALFLAQNFPMADKDIIYVSNADMVEVTKFLQFVNNVTAGTAGPAADVATGKDAVSSIRN
jgi:polysaccharide export outer membrane protein